MKNLGALCLALLLSNILAAKEIKVGNTVELVKAVTSANPVDKIYLKQGRYAFGATLAIERDGRASAVISLLDDPADAGRPLLDFSAMPEKSSSNGLLLKASYWHIKGIDITKAGHNGLKVQGGSQNLIEHCTFYQCRDTGLQLSDGASHNTVINCDAYENSDSKRENADGFACKMDVGTGNRFVGCRSWNNMDDGWDGYLRGADSVTTSYENCWAFLNGVSKDGVVSGGDGNGFKTGGSDEKTLKHNALYTRCIAAANVADGFDHNSNRGKVTLLHCVASGNKRNMAFLKDNPLSRLTVKNSIVHGPVGKLVADTIDTSHNSWQTGAAVTDSDFKGVDVKQLLLPRKEDGGLPDISYMVPVAGSHMIDAGVAVGLPYHPTAPDLGAVELKR